MVRIGGGQGFYGDGYVGVGPLLAEGVDYLVCEALAELTLAILAKDRARDETAGWTRDLPIYASMVAPAVLAGDTKFITNAGGINPIAAGRAVLESLKAQGHTGVKVATVVGDDLRPHAGELGLDPDAVFAAAYLGAAPIVDALDAGADMVITGRVADASLFLAPLIHEFGWSYDDWDRMAAGVTVGHLLECSAQVSGGNYSGDWWANGDFSRPGFPIAECEADGTAVITKPSGTGGRVSFDTVREQLMYEVQDPTAYLNPDVTADFTSVRLEEVAQDRVAVSRREGDTATRYLQGSRLYRCRFLGRGQAALRVARCRGQGSSSGQIPAGEGRRPGHRGTRMARGVLRCQRLRRSHGRPGRGRCARGTRSRRTGRGHGSPRVAVLTSGPTPDD